MNMGKQIRGQPRYVVVLRSDDAKVLYFLSNRKMHEESLMHEMPSLSGFSGRNCPFVTRPSGYWQWQWELRQHPTVDMEAWISEAFHQIN